MDLVILEHLLDSVDHCISLVAETPRGRAAIEAWGWGEVPRLSWETGVRAEVMAQMAGLQVSRRGAQ